MWLALEDRLIEIAEGVSRIGRSLVADVRFEDPTVSRRHALLVRRGDELLVLDDRSVNGVFVNGERVADCPVRDGDVITIGRHTLTVLAERPAAAEPEPAAA
jgi:pSer/pThr/pTyr-binding forkhead associated (FHA) protein